MTERKLINFNHINVGECIKEHRLALGKNYDTREKFINNRSEELFDGEDWLSVRHLSNLELGKNTLTLEMILLLATALEIDPLDFFKEILSAYHQ